MTVLLAGVAMFVKDLFATFLVVAEANNRPWIAGILDVGMDLAQFAWMALGFEAILNGDVTQIVLVLVALAVGSMAATVSGVVIGHRLMPDRRPLPAGR